MRKKYGIINRKLYPFFSLNCATKNKYFFTVQDHLVSLYLLLFNDDVKINTSNGVARLGNLKDTIKQKIEPIDKILE